MFLAAILTTCVSNCTPPNVSAGSIAIFLAAFVLISKVTAEETTTEYKIELSVKNGSEREESKVYDSQQWVKLQNQTKLNNSLRKSEQLEETLSENLKNSTGLNLRPNSHGPPIDVRADVEIRELLQISEVDMEMKLNMVMELRWQDPRRQLSDKFIFPGGGVWVDNSVKEKIWIPKVSILNEKESVDHSAGFVDQSLNWDDYGRMLLRINIATTVSCSMSLEDFPMDEQNCSILVGSPNYDDRQMKLEVYPYLHPVFSSSVKNVELLGVRVSPLAQEVDTSNRTIYSYELLLRRYVGYYIIGTFFPSALVVFISWLTFWMARDAAGERMALGVTCVLTITTLLISSQASSPKVSYIKAIDIYMGVCFTLVFTTLLQSTAVGYLLRKVRIQEAVRKLEAGAENAGANQPARGFASIVHRVMSGGLEAEEKPKVIKFILRCDVWCRIMYPLIFLIFNVTYWVYYLTGTKFDLKQGWQEPKTYAGVYDSRLHLHAHHKHSNVSLV